MSDADEPQDGQLGPVIGFMTDNDRVHISLTRATASLTLGPDQILPPHPGNRALHLDGQYEDAYIGACAPHAFSPYIQRDLSFDYKNEEWDGNLDNLDFFPVHRLDQSMQSKEQCLDDMIEGADVEIHEAVNDDGEVTRAIIYEITVWMDNSFKDLHIHDTPQEFTQKNDSYRPHPSFNRKRIEMYNHAEAIFEMQMPRTFKDDRWAYNMRLKRIQLSDRQRGSTKLTNFTPELPKKSGLVALDEFGEADLRDVAESLLLHEDRPTATKQDIREAFIADLPKIFIDPISETLLEDAVHIVGTNAAKTLVSRQPFYQYQETAHKTCRKDRATPITGHEHIGNRRHKWMDYIPIAIPNATDVQPNPFVPYTEAAHADNMAYEYVKLRLRRDKLIKQMDRMQESARKNHQKEVQEFQEQVEGLQHQVEEGQERERRYQDQVRDLQKQLGEVQKG